jgi:sugar phosphate isomerase/epimerase
MRAGISTACFYPYINTEDTLDVIKDLGFNVCETFLETESETTYDYANMLKEKADKLGLNIYSVHAFAASFEPFLFDRYPRRRMEMQEKFKSVCKAASILGAECYTFHGLRKNPMHIDIKEVAKEMDDLCKIAAQYNVKLAWENVAWCRTNDPSFVKNVVENMKEDIYFTLDIKQAIRSGHTPKEYLGIYKNRILNLHINDASEKSSCLLPGKGTVNLTEVADEIKMLNENIPFIIEVYNENFDTFEDLIKARSYVEALGRSK